jgi:hypothetical protein
MGTLRANGGLKQRLSSADGSLQNILNMTAPEQPTESFELLDKVVANLAEHYDTVQIIVTRHDGDAGTLVRTRGCGNWSARYGSAKEYIENCEETFRADSRRKNES